MDSAETDLVVSYVKNPNCSGLTLLGGEPFQNVQGLLSVVRAVREAAPEKRKFGPIQDIK